MHVGLAINYCSWVFALTPCVSPQKMVLLCKLFLVLFKETLFIWGASLVAQTVKNLPAIRETWVHSMGWEDPMEKGTATHSSIWGWIFFYFYCKNVPTYSRVERQCSALVDPSYNFNSNQHGTRVVSSIPPPQKHAYTF